MTGRAWRCTRGPGIRDVAAGSPAAALPIFCISRHSCARPAFPIWPRSDGRPSSWPVMRCAEMLLAVGCTTHLVAMSPCNARGVSSSYVTVNTQSSETGVLLHPQGARCL